MIPLHYLLLMFQKEQKEALSWLENNHVATYYIEDSWFFDESGFSRVFDINQQFSRYGGYLKNKVISQEKKIDKVVGQLGDLAFLLISLEKISPALHLLIQEMAYLIPNDQKRNIFLDIFSGMSVPDVAKKYSLNINQTYKLHKSNLNLIKQKFGFIKNYRDTLANNELTIRKLETAYKIQMGKTERLSKIQHYADKDYFLKKEMNSPIEIPEKDMEILLLSLQDNFGLNRRTINCFHSIQIKTVTDLLYFINKNGTNGLFAIPHFGKKTVQDLKMKLTKAGIFDDSFQSYLSRYFE